MEIKVLLLLLTVHCIGLLFRKKNSNVLSCGIIAWSGSNPKKFNKQKFDIIGLFNNSRGGDSCGVSTDGEIYYGTLLNKAYDDFVLNKGYIVPQIVPAAIGHTRKASVGSVNETNAHPFGFGSFDEGFEFVGCHNGTLHNHDDLAKEFGVAGNVYNENNAFVRSKGDSEILLEILYKSRTTEVLEKYIGGAAIVFQDLKEPNKIYAFHGASKKETDDIDETHYEERPLYYYQESKDSVYISSMEEPLRFIGGVVGETILEFKHNILYEIENGNVSKATRHKINRKGAGQRKSYKSGFSAGGRNTTTTREYPISSHLKKEGRKDRSKTRRSKKLENVSNIHEETIIADDFKSGVYYNRLRYWRNGHTIAGIFTYVKNWGLIKIEENHTKINDRIYRLLGSYFSFETGNFVNDKDVDNLLKTDATLFIPFDYTEKEPPLFYFYDGIMLETVHDYVVLTSAFAPKFSFEHMSQMSKYPICKISKHKPGDDRQGIYKGGRPYTDNFVPLQCNNLYSVEGGNLISIERFEDEVVKEAESCCSINTDAAVKATMDVIQLPLFNFKKDNPSSIEGINLVKPIVAFNDKPTVEFLDEDPPIENLVEEDVDKTYELINKHIMPIYETMQVCNENLKNEDSAIIRELIDLQKEYLISIDCVIESKEK